MNKATSIGIKMTSFVLGVLMVSLMLTYSIIMILHGVGLIPSGFLATLWMPVVTVFVSFLVGSWISALLVPIFFKPINEMLVATKAFAKGDFTVRVNDRCGNAEMRELLSSFNQMAEELDSIEIFRSDFINNFSHEFKTPIVSIRGFAKQLKNSDLPPEIREEYIDIIISESERLTNMSANVLLLSKLEAQQIINDRQIYSVDEQIRNCILLLEKQWTSKDIDLDIDLEPILYLGNSEIMSHVWINLLGNAIKFTPEGGKLVIRLHYDDGNMVFSVQDSGIGMNKECLEHIFDKFYQVDSSHAASGNGLGLALVKRIVNMCKGEIQVESEPGVGSTFTVVLPNEVLPNEIAEYIR
ncbi:MAG: ATP-binding protein [Bacillota bacterium]|jgi:signal transduction histidine kinase